MYGTEVADLAMVSGIGAAVRRVSGMKNLPCVDIHVLQEPHHVDEASNALEPELSDEQYGRSSPVPKKCGNSGSLLF
jgi:hypothetical protein